MFYEGNVLSSKSKAKAQAQTKQQVMATNWKVQT